MLTQEENELICRVGPGTPMGNLFREYWLPAMLSEELPQPGQRSRSHAHARRAAHRLPRHQRQSRPAWQNNCPHRGASLFFGRNEEAGLRCVYHGWKFDVDGQLHRHAQRARRVRLPNRKSEPSPTRPQERGGIVWAYLGPRQASAAAARPRGQHAARRARPGRTSNQPTGSRSSRATSTPPTSASCTTAACSPRTCRRAASRSTSCASAPRTSRSSTPTAAPPTPRRRPAYRRPDVLAHRAVDLPVVFAWRRQACSGWANATPAKCRWTTTTPSPTRCR